MKVDSHATLVFSTWALACVLAGTVSHRSAAVVDRLRVAGEPPKAVARHAISPARPSVGASGGYQYLFAALFAWLHVIDDTANAGAALPAVAVLSCASKSKFRRHWGSEVAIVAMRGALLDRGRRANLVTLLQLVVKLTEGLEGARHAAALHRSCAAAVVALLDAARFPDNVSGLAGLLTLGRTNAPGWAAVCFRTAGVPHRPHSDDSRPLRVAMQARHVYANETGAAAASPASPASDGAAAPGRQTRVVLHDATGRGCHQLWAVVHPWRGRGEGGADRADSAWHPSPRSFIVSAPQPMTAPSLPPSLPTRNPRTDTQGHALISAPARTRSAYYASRYSVSHKN